MRLQPLRLRKKRLKMWLQPLRKLCKFLLKLPPPRVQKGQRVKPKVPVQNRRQRRRPSLLWLLPPKARSRQLFLPSRSPARAAQKWRRLASRPSPPACWLCRHARRSPRRSDRGPLERLRQLPQHLLRNPLRPALRSSSLPPLLPPPNVPGLAHRPDHSLRGRLDHAHASSRKRRRRTST